MPVNSKTKKPKKVKLEIWNERMLAFMQHCVDNNLCGTQKEFLESIGFPAYNISQAKNGTQSFTVQQIRTAALKYNLNLNWLIGLDPEMKRKKGRSALQQLKDAVMSVEMELS